MSENTGTPEAQVETTSVFRADLLKEMESGAGSAPAAAGADNLPEGAGLLVVKRGPNAGARFLLDQPITTAGRHPESDIFLDDVTVSRRHASSASPTASSRSTTWVPSTAPTSTASAQQQALTTGDEIQIGKFRLVFLAGPKND